MNKSISSYLFKFAERILTHATTFIVSIVLARILTPSDYGTVSILLVFITLLQVIIEGGLTSALIQKKDIKEDDYNITLTLSLMLAAVSYIILFAISHSIELWLNMPGLRDAFRIIALVLFPSAFLSVVKAKLVRNMQFKLQMIVTFIVSLVSGTFGIVAAEYGLGFWALIIQQVSNTFLLVILFSLALKWIPRLVIHFEINRAKELYDYGWKIMLTNLLVRSNNELISLAVGKHYSKASLGLYTRGKQFPQAAAENIEGTIQSVLFPILSRCQSNVLEVKEKARNMTKLSSFAMFYILTFIGATSPTYIPLLLTNKWISCVPFLMLWCLCYMPSVYNVIATTTINSVGNSNMTLKRQLMITIPNFTITIIIVCLTQNPIMVMVAKAVMLPYSFIVTSYFLMKSVNYTRLEQLHDLMPSLCVAGIMFVIVYFENLIAANRVMLLLIQFITSITIYLGLSKAFKVSGYNILIQQIKRITSRNN